ncbi:MAG TPA: ParB/RepB/Spo0J family partition protein [Vicinamibacterales bacterium]
MHELESQQADDLRADLEDTSDPDALDPAVSPASRQREGLPAHYRMRAERHYVDHLVAPSLGTPIRLVPVGNFSDADQARAKELDALIRSIRAHGVIQPLLVRKEDDAYRVIAGRKRLCAAMAAGLTEVPCIIHQVDDAGEASLRSAESVRGELPPQTVPARTADPMRAAVGTKLADGVTEIARDLARLRKTIGVARSAVKGFERAAAVDLIAAETWRTLWLANVTAFLSTGRSPEEGSKTLSSVIDEVVQSFEPECRLSQLRIAVTHGSDVRTTVDRGLMVMALTGAVIVTLSFLEQTAEPHVDVRSKPLGGGFALEIGQHQTVVPHYMADRFSSQAFSARGAGAFGLAAIALSHATAMYGGASQLVVSDDADGTTVRLTFPHP